MARWARKSHQHPPCVKPTNWKRAVQFAAGEHSSHLLHVDKLCPCHLCHQDIQSTSVSNSPSKWRGRLRLQDDIRILSRWEATAEPTSHSLPLPIPFATSWGTLLTPLAPSTHGSSLKTSRLPPPSITARKIGPTFFRIFFLLAAAWVDPGRNALQSAEQRC